MKRSQYFEPLFDVVAAIFVVVAILATIGCIALSALICFGVYELIIHLVGG
jgi:hypothetical protein